MVIGTDPNGSICMVIDGSDSSVMPAVWNGIVITAIVLTKDQQAAYAALPADRAGTSFDGKAFSVVVAQPVPVAVASDPADLIIADPVALAKLKVALSK